jgi:hypothetical protein
MKYFITLFETMSINENAPNVQESCQDTLFVDILSNPVQAVSNPAQAAPRVLPTFPKPPESCFVKQYAPCEPRHLLPLHFTTAKTLSNVFEVMETFLEGKSFTTCTSSWRGVIAEDNEYTKCDCYIFVYKSRKDPNDHIIEVQNVNRGDGFVFGEFYTSLKKAFA